MHKVYWSKYNIFNNLSNQMMEYSPSPVISSYAKNNPKPISNDVNWLGCPSTQKFLKNTFSFKNPLELNMQINKNKTVYWPDTNIEDFISIRDYSDKSVILDYLLPVTLFSSHDIAASITAPYLSKQSPHSAHIVPGEFNISKWFRPILPSYMIYDLDLSFSINKGEDLFYIKFNTDEKIDFVEFYFNETLKEIVSDSMNLKRFKKNSGLDYLYNIFKSEKINKIVLKEIEKCVI